jgi:hypothetical protein
LLLLRIMRRYIFLAFLLLASSCVIIHDDDDDSGSLDTCGGFAPPCADPDEYCDFPRNTCGVADEPGVCRARPTTCAEIFAPVQACDGNVYDNACEAAAAGFDQSGDAIAN